MRANNTEHLLAAAQRRRESTEARAVNALTAIATDSGPITVARLAEQAGVSRSWIYTQPDLLARLEQLAQQRGPAARRPPPEVAHGATIGSLRRRLELSHERVKQLADENRRLRDELSVAYGQLRTKASRSDITKEQS